MPDDHEEVTGRFRRRLEESAKSHGEKLQSAMVATQHAVELAYRWLSIAAPGKPVLLIVDDDPSVCSAWRRLMRVEDEYECLTAERFDDALRVLDQARRIDVVVLDHMLDEGHIGLEFLQSLRQVWPNVPVIVASGYDDPKIRQQYLDVGMRDVIFEPKPIASRTVDNVIRRKSSPPQGTRAVTAEVIGEMHRRTTPLSVPVTKEPKK